LLFLEEYIMDNSPTITHLLDDNNRRTGNIDANDPTVSTPNVFPDSAGDELIHKEVNLYYI
jgi:hypothetical protein